MKKLIALLALGALATPALAGDTDNVLVNIQVAEEVQLWSNDANINLVLDGANQENSDIALSSLSRMNNVAANITAQVTGTLPAPIVPGGGIQFFLFNSNDAVAVNAAIVANAYNPAGALAWNASNLGDTKTFASGLPVATSITPVNVAYAAAAPGELPLPNSFQLTVTWTIAVAP